MKSFNLESKIRAQLRSSTRPAPQDKEHEHRSSSTYTRSWRHSTTTRTCSSISCFAATHPNIRGSSQKNYKEAPYLKPAKDWKKAREEAVVKPFAGDVKSYAGFFTVSENYDSNMYFWFFLSEKKHEKAPVILWLHGGAGQSSMMGLFEESGLYKIVDGKATLRETSWTKHYNVLYLDNPVGAGFSYTKDRNGYSKTIDHAADNLYEAMTQFYKMFPEYEKNAFT